MQFVCVTQNGKYHELLNTAYVRWVMRHYTEFSDPKADCVVDDKGEFYECVNPNDLSNAAPKYEDCLVELGK